MQLCNRKILPLRNRLGIGLTVVASLCGAMPSASGAVPGWLHEAAQAKLPQYPPETKAVLLFSEQVTKLSDNGEIVTTNRNAYMILGSEGRSYGEIRVTFGREIKLDYLKAWTITANGKEIENNEKDAVEGSIVPGTIFTDLRSKTLRATAADPGAIVGFEYELKLKPYVLENSWWFQQQIPVRQARFVLRLPKGWAFSTHWVNHAAEQPQELGDNSLAWEVENVPSLEPEDYAPPWRSLAGRLVITYSPAKERIQSKALSSWSDIGQWYANLAIDRRQASPAIRQKVAELAAAAPTSLAKVEALARFVQRDIRYVAIELGIGGYQPHPAPLIFSNRYGDCKDKATLLSVMLREIGVDSYYALAQVQRGVVVPDIPSAASFNHAILAIQLKEDAPEDFQAVIEYKPLGKVLLFDPTYQFTPFGSLPYYLQGNTVLLVTEHGGELVDLPVPPAASNRILHTAHLALASDGTLSGEVRLQEVGVPAALDRARYSSMAVGDRTRSLENSLGRQLNGFRLLKANLGKVDEIDVAFDTSYQFAASQYAKPAGELLLLRPQVVGRTAVQLKLKNRKYPVEFPNSLLESDIFEITLPPGYTVDELPPPLDMAYSFAEYSRKLEVDGRIVRCIRRYQLTTPVVKIDDLQQLQEFERKIAEDERSNIALKRSAP
jgi:hypothetical protein